MSIDNVLQQVRRLMEGLPLTRDFALLVPNRTFKREGTLQLWTGEQWEDVYAYLFSDIILWGVTKRNSVTSAQYTFECLLPLDTGDVAVKDATTKLSSKQSKANGQKVSLAELFEVRAEPPSNYVYLLRAVTVADRDAWVGTLRKCVMDSVRERKDNEFNEKQAKLAAPGVSAAPALPAASAAADDDDSEESESSGSSSSASEKRKKKGKKSIYRRSRRLDKMGGGVVASAKAAAAAAAAAVPPPELPAPADDEAAAGAAGTTFAAMMQLVDQNDVKSVKRILRRRAAGKDSLPWHGVDANGVPLLSKAILRAPAIAELLVSEPSVGDDVLLVKDLNENTALHAAAVADDDGAILALLRRRPDLSQERNVEGNTPLHLYAKNATNTDVLKIGMAMLDSGANADARNSAGETPLHFACLNPAAKANVLLQLVVILLSHDASPNAATTTTLETPLHYAARKGHAEVCKQLLQGGGDLTLKNSAGLTPTALADDSPAGRDVKSSLAAAMSSLDALKTALADVGLDAVLATPELNAALLHQREARLAGEIVMFWNEASAFQAIADAAERVDRANEIFARYFVAEAEHEIGISKAVRVELKANLNHAGAQVFAAAQAELVDKLHAQLVDEGLTLKPRGAPGSSGDDKSASKKLKKKKKEER
jgi:hypothetical protein